ncbi:MAG: hypothetical protein K9M45_02320 [Kiritimatiellales bacterium]|nr:hypothetical protein [Kiritimatiellales bacterium]
MARRVKNYLIYPKFQILMVFTNLAIVLVALVILYAAMSIHFNSYDELDKVVRPEEYPHYSEFIGLQRKSFFLYFTSTGVIVFMSALVGNIILTHKIVGPMHRLRLFFTEFKPGDRVGFRKGDFFDDLPAVINKRIIELERHNEKPTT